MIKIAHVSTVFNPGIVTRDTYALAIDQRRRGWTVEFVAGRNASRVLMEKRIKEGFPVIRVSSMRKYAHPLDDLRALCDLVRLFKLKKYDVVHTHLAKAGILGRLAARLAGIKTVIHTVYGASFAPTLPRWKYLAFWGLEKLAAWFTDQYIFIGRDIRDAYVNAGICPLEKTAVIYPGKNLEPFLAVAALPAAERKARRQALGIDPEAIVLGNVSRLVPWKGHEYALQALSVLKKDYHRLKLVIVGAAKVAVEQAYKEKLEALAQTLGLGEEVIFTGWQEDTPNYYSIFDIYLITSMPFEGLNLSVLEAYAAGLPVVGFEWYGAGDILGTKSGLVPVKDVPGLLASLRREIERLPETRRRRGDNLAEIKKLQERHTYARMAAKTGDLYEKLLASPGCSASEGKLLRWA